MTEFPQRRSELPLSERSPRVRQRGDQTGTCHPHSAPARMAQHQTVSNASCSQPHQKAQTLPCFNIWAFKLQFIFLGLFFKCGQRADSIETGNSWGKLQSSLHVSPRELEEHEQGQRRVRFLPCLSPNAPPAAA